ncbi:uncharacterized protein M6B38_299760 [Iris pallida]|uniref:Retrotransposon gag domain-containing protein n=1 Tax=Iris pallida TaxID=29817 RepID=A0AAX6HQL2_IRIPA|nr:uncharacterized protein M6B38_299760 [Iris pallida]
MMALLQQMLQTQSAQAEVLRPSMVNSHQLAMVAVERDAPGTVQGAPVQQQGQGRPGTCLDFRKMNPRDFKGTEGIIYADDWLEDVQRSLELAEVPKGLWVTSATSQFFDIALTWFRTDPRASMRGLTWESFRRLFKEKFYPDVALTALEGPFASLVQGNSSVDEYAAEFFRLSRFVPGLIQDEGYKARKFWRGLIHAVHTRTSGRRDATFEQILMEVQITEEDFGLKPKRGSDVLGASSSAGPAKRPHVQKEYPQRDEAQVQQQRQGDRASLCNYCRKPGHSWDIYRKRLKVCLFCGSTVHQMRDCPNVPPSGGAQGQKGGDRPPVAPHHAQHQRGSAFAMAVEETDAADDDEGDCPTFYGAYEDDTQEPVCPY